MTNNLSSPSNDASNKGSIDFTLFIAIRKTIERRKCSNSAHDTRRKLQMDESKPEAFALAHDSTHNPAEKTFFESELFRLFKATLKESPSSGKPVMYGDPFHFDKPCCLDELDEIIENKDIDAILVFWRFMTREMMDCISSKNFTFVQIAEKAIESGAEVNKQNEHGQSPLMFASMYGSADMASLLIKSNAQLEATDVYGKTALIYACRFAYIRCNNDILNVLIGSRADMKATDNRGLLPLHHAIESLVRISPYEGGRGNSIECIESLVINGAHLSEKSKYSKTPLQMLREHRQNGGLSADEFHSILSLCQ